MKHKAVTIKIHSRNNLYNPTGIKQIHNAALNYENLALIFSLASQWLNLV